MKFAVIGPGRVGTLLALALPRAGHRLEAVVGRGEDSLAAFRGRVAGARVTSLAEAAERAELLVIATPDSHVESIARALAVDDLVGEGHRIVHLAGAHGLAPLRAAALCGARVAAAHPAQTVPSGAAPDDLVGAAWGVTCAQDDRNWVREFVHDLGGDVHDVRDEDRVLYHAALTLGSNAVGAAVSAARQLLLAARIKDPAAFLAGLSTASVENVLSSGVSALTGPIVRGDVTTVARHLEVLDRDLPQIAAAYRHLQRAVVTQTRTQLSAEQSAALDAVLGDG